MNAPDLVLFVGEALVGNEAIDQLVKFNAELVSTATELCVRLSKIIDTQCAPPTTSTRVSAVPFKNIF